MLYKASHLFIFFLAIFLSSNAFSQSHKLLGKFIYLNPSDSRNIGGHEYYFYLSTNKGQRMAYPAIIKNKDLIKKIKSNLSKTYFIEGNIQRKNIIKGEIKQEIEILTITKANTIELKDISAPKNYNPKGIKIGDKVTIMNPNKSDVITINNVNDTVTNVTIFTAGAALLASILLGK